MRINSNNVPKLLVLVGLLFYRLSVCSITIAHQYGCDTLLNKGTFSQLENVQNNIVKLLNAAYEKGDKEGLATLSALACENMAAMGFYKGAVEYGEQSIALYEEILASPNSGNNSLIRYNYASILMDMANLSSHLMENYEKTINLYKKSSDEYVIWAKDIIKKGKISSNDKKRIDYITIPLQYGSFKLSLMTHDYYTARKEVDKYIEEVKIFFKNSAETHLEYAKALQAKATLFDNTEDFEQSLHLWKQSLSIIKESIGKNTQLYAYTLGKIAGVYNQINDLHTAFSYYKKSHDAYICAGYTISTGTAESLELGALILMGQGNWQQADSLVNTAKDIFALTCGENSYQSFQNEVYKVYTEWETGHYSDSYNRVKKLLDNDVFLSNLTNDNVLDALSLYIDIGNHLGYYQNTITNEKEYENILSSFQHPSKSTIRNFYIALARAYQAAGKRIEACSKFEKALSVHREMAHENFRFLSETQRTDFWQRDLSRFQSILLQNRARKTGYNAVGSLLYNAALLQKGLLLDASTNIAKIVEDKGSEELKNKMAILHQMAQSALTDKQKEEYKLLETEVQNEARKLGDFMNYTDITWQDVKNNLKDNEVAIEFVCSEESGIYWYSAEILRKNMDKPYHLFLFTLDNDSRRITSHEGVFNEYAKKVIWNDSLLNFLIPGDDVYFSPAGELHKLPIEHLTLKNGTLINEVYRMHRVSSTRILSQKREVKNNNKSIAIFGGFNYNTSIEDLQLLTTYNASRGSSSNKNSKSLRSKLWLDLPGTLKEVNEIAPIMKNANYDVRLFTKDEGIEENFKALSGGGTDIIHIATHGYFTPSDTTIYGPAGLIFTGGNNYWINGSGALGNDMEDGILTADEISHLNLIGTDLLVMSACQSGLGEVSGEGVFGLQRSFKKAGVNSIIMSLWEVDDEATQQIMTYFYQNYANGASKYEALKSAQKRIQKKKFYRNGEKCKGSDPIYWSAFVLID